MTLNWIDGNVTPSLLNTNTRLILLRTDGQFSLGIFTPGDGWFDILDSEEISSGLISCYIKLDKPRKKETIKTQIEWS